MLSSYYSQKFLKLSGVLIKDIYDDNGTTIIEIQMERKPHLCPRYGHVTFYNSIKRALSPKLLRKIVPFLIFFF
jgi:hypothetical protein